MQKTTALPGGFGSGKNDSSSLRSAPTQDHRGVDLISAVLAFGRLWYTKPADAVSYARFYSRSHDAVIRVYDAAGNVIETHEYKGGF